MHRQYMQRALDLATLGFVSPNPRVGAVLVKNNRIIAEGFHKKYGDAHAEIELFNSLSPNFDYQNCILYISLEPCAHYGKTPPCVEMIVSKGIKKVVIACLDPNPLVAGKGVKILQNAGIEVIVGILEEQATELNEAFFQYITTKLPFIVIKSGISFDAKICTTTGESQWITSEESRYEAHILRSQYSAIMVGINTVLQDDPLLTSRIPHGRNPIRIILDTQLRTPLNSRLVQSAKHIKTIIVTANLDNNDAYLTMGVQILHIPTKLEKINLNILMQKLSEMNIDSILIEGGGELIFSALEARIVNKMILYIAPILIGGQKSKSFIEGEGIAHLSDAFRISSYKIRQLSQDFVLEAYLKNH